MPTVVHDPAANPFGVLNSTHTALELLTPQRMKRSLRASADWICAAIDAAKGKGVGYRDAGYFADGSMQWYNPRSNSGETINSLLFLAGLLEDPTLRQRAMTYADGMIGDPVHGIYQGPHKEAHGIPWYWADVGGYTGIYGMRLPAAFDALHQNTGKAIYQEFMYLCGDLLVSRQTPIGLSDAGWSPEQGFFSRNIDSRYGFTAGTFALLYKRSGQQKYLDAMNRIVECFVKLQNPDGSFAQTFNAFTGEATVPSIKLHMFGYIMNGMMDAYRLVPDPKILLLCQKLAAFCAKVFYYRGTMPYCFGPAGPRTDELHKDAFYIDPITGLMKLYGQDKNPAWLDIAVKMWVDSYLRQPIAPDRPGLHGTFVHGDNYFIEGPDPAVSPLSRRDSNRVGRSCLYLVNQYILCASEIWPMIVGNQGHND